MRLYDKILGGLIGAAAGDAMGAATEGRTYHQILSYFGHEVIDFEKPPMDTFGAGNVPGQVTDDFSLAFFIAKHIVNDNHGEVDEKVVQNALIDWSEHAVFFDRFAGPTTRLAIKRYKGEKVERSGGVELVTRQATNGAAMKISPIGLLNAGNIDGAIRDAAKVTMVTHDNYLAVSGACAVAAAVSCAVQSNADFFDVLEAGYYGAAEGERIGKKIARDVAGPSVIRKMKLAVEIGLGDGTPHDKMIDIGEKIGTGLHISEAVPSAFGILAANRGSAMETIIASVNVGYDTDTLATIAGGIAGALQGKDAFPTHFLSVLESANHLEIEKLAQQITDIVHKKGEGLRYV